MKFNRKTAISLLCLLITLSMLAAVGVQTVFADGVVVNVNSSSGTGRSAQSIGGDYGIRLGINGAFTEVSVSMPTWSTTDSAATLSLYAWDTNYDLTIMSDPLVTQRFDPLRDNAYNKLTFDALPAGEYFLRIHDVRGQVGVWVQNYSDNGSFVYTNGSEGRRDWDMKVTFAETEQPFFQLEPQTIVEPDEPVIIPEDSLSHQTTVMPDTWVFTDGLGRVSLTYADVGAPREDKTLAMFYWTWHTKETASKGAVNTTELLKEYPDAKNDYNHAAWQGKGHYCFWNEPIYGFYTTEDPWVLRRQAELLANAGVDTVFTDNTNGGFTWRESYLVLYPTWEEALKSGGVDVPKVSFLLPFGAHDGAISQANVIYHDIYKPGLYKDLWFYWDDKPMLMGIRTAVPDGEIGKEIKSFFSWRAGQPEYLVAGTAAKQWGWLSTYPQALYSPTGAKGLKKGEVEQMSVGVAVNHNYVTHEITAMNGENVMGRSYTSDYPDRYEKEGPDASLWGYQFAEQFNYALEVDPEVIFVTGWNEWHAWRQPNPWGGANSQVNNALVDQFDNEHSRDLEPTKGELKDHYYYQFVNFARQYKGVNPIPEPSFAATIDLGAGQAQWKDIAPYYEAYANNTGDRKSSGYGNYKYTETSGRNDLIGAQVARDDEYVYFNVECAEDITPYTDSLWMTLYIDSDQSNQGWETFEYVINKSAASADTVVLEKFSGNGYESVKVADCAYTVDGRYMTVKVAKSDLGLSSNDFTINFSWTDNVHDEGDYSSFSGDIMDFYISGDVAPGARFKYSYVSTQQNAVPAPPTTEEETTEPVESTDAPATESEQETEPEAEGGCKSMTASAALIACICLGAIVIGKKKN